MKNEAEFNTIVKNSIEQTFEEKSEKVYGKAFKISDMAGAMSYGATVKSPFDGFGIIYKDGWHSIYWESKFNKSLASINFNRIEPHQAENLKAYGLSSNNICYFILGMTVGRADNRAYVFLAKDVLKYYPDHSIHAKELEQLPYNEIHKNIFEFKNIITESDLNKIKIY
jgi:penicillin-binding protein-related factor A (putative recombinase)